MTNKESAITPEMVAAEIKRSPAFKDNSEDDTVDVVIDEGKRVSEGINDAWSFDDLYRAIKFLGGITSEDKIYYKSDELIDAIKALRNKIIRTEEDIRSIMRVGGLREKVIELLEKDPLILVDEKNKENERVATKIGPVDTEDKLYAAIDELGTIKGSDEYTSEELKFRIDGVLRGARDLRYITNTGGLRDKVKELFEKRQI